MESFSGKSRSTNSDFNECLRKRKIVLFSKASKLVGKEITAAWEDLSEAQDRYLNKRFKYATVNSYYAIFHSARALLYSKGYRERSHYCLTIALEALFVESKILDARYIRLIREGMALREEADYTGSFSKENAQMSISNAEEFVKIAVKILRAEHMIE